MDNIVYAVKACRRLDASVLAGTVKRIHEAIERAFEPTSTEGCETEDEFKQLEEYNAEEVKAIKKRAVLSWIGFCNMQTRMSWSEVSSMYAEDSQGPIKQRQYLGEGIWKFKCATEILDLRSMCAIGRIAIQIEQCMVDKARRLLKDPKVERMIKTYGWHVDGVFFT